MIANLLADLPDAGAGEVFTALLRRPGIRIERIVSRGQATPEDAPMVQDWDEWVLLLEGAAGLRIGDEGERVLRPELVGVSAGAPKPAANGSENPAADAGDKPAH